MSWSTAFVAACTIAAVICLVAGNVDRALLLLVLGDLEMVKSGR